MNAARGPHRYLPGHGLECAWELDQTDVAPVTRHRHVSKVTCTTVVFHRESCTHPIHFIIPVQPVNRTYIRQIRHLADNVGKISDIHVRVAGFDFRTQQARYSTVRACMWLVVLIQQFMHRPLCLSTHSAFDLKVGRGTPAECPGHRFFPLLRKIRDAGILCPVLK